jgi:hypothetical protein
LPKRATRFLNGVTVLVKSLLSFIRQHIHGENLHAISGKEEQGKESKTRSKNWQKVNSKLALSTGSSFVPAANGN